jgi:Cu2+-exporting ATPase
VEWIAPDGVAPLVLALEQGSSHPLAEGFRRAWPEVRPAIVESAEHVTGGGLRGRVDGQDVWIGSPGFVRPAVRSVHPMIDAAQHTADGTLTPVHIVVDGVLVGIAGLGDRIRDDAAPSLATLRARGWRTVLLSGDTPEVASAVGATLGFASTDIIGGASPEAKLAYVEQAKTEGTIVMVGDGVNDAAAIAAAHVGIGVHGGAEACLATADIYLTRPGLAALVALTDGARGTMRVIRRNIGFSIGYNMVGASLAIAGVLTPLIASILMPAASITVVMGSWLGRTFPKVAGVRG